jgi:hypothetical protein
LKEQHCLHNKQTDLHVFLPRFFVSFLPRPLAAEPEPLAQASKKKTWNWRAEEIGLQKFEFKLNGVVCPWETHHQIKVLNIAFCTTTYHVDLFLQGQQC